MTDYELQNQNSAAAAEASVSICESGAPAENGAGGPDGSAGPDAKSRKATLRKQYEALLASENDMLVLFSGDERLTCTVDDSQERFVLLPDEKKVLVPLAFFSSQKFSRNRFLFHLYSELALYPDYEANPGLYLARPETFRREAEEISSVFIEKVSAQGLSGDKAFQPENVLAYAQNEIVTFLQDCDAYAAVLCVMQKAPVYQDPAVKKDIAEMLLMEDLLPAEDDPTAVHRDLAPCLITREFWGRDAVESDRIRRVFDEPVFGTDRFSFLRQQLTECAVSGKGIAERDRIIRTFLMPSYLQLFREDIRRMELSSTVDLKDQEKQADRSRRKRAAQSRQNYQEMLQELDSEKQKRAAAAQELLTGRRDLSEYGVTPEDRTLFDHYEAAVRPAREAMKEYWRRLIGDTSREISVRIPNMPKGRLSVPSLIHSWPDLTEAERRQNYRGLAIFDDSELRKQTQVLPKYLDISFVIDSSGSMRGGKLAPAREALAIVLLSLEDFAAYMRENAQITHELCEVRTDVRLFGTDSRKVLSREDTGEKRKADLILSVARLDGSMGSTDDGACLNEILKELTPRQIREQKTGKRILMVFEVTDGASSFPGAAKKAVEKLRNDRAVVQAIEIGSPDDAFARASFEYVFGDSGLFLGDRTDELPSKLLQTVRDSVSGVLREYFRRSGS